MTRLLSVFLLQFIYVCIASAQGLSLETDDHWRTFRLQAKPSVTGDSCLVFVSNRYIHKDSLRFVDEHLDTASLKYFVLDKRDGRWNVYQAGCLDEAMRYLPRRKDIVVYAEGMGKTFTGNVYRAQLMSRQYDVNVVMFDYASINTTYKPSKNFRYARANAAASAGQYLSLLKELREARLQQAPWIAGVKVTAFYHSMGNIILEKMMQQHDVDAVNDTAFIDNLVLNAACVPQKGHAAWVERIRFAQHIYVHYNRTDLQLKGAHLLTMRRQLGEKISRRRASNALYVNFHELVGWQHSYFMNFPHNTKFKLSAAMTAYFGQLLTGQRLTAWQAGHMLANVPVADDTSN